MNTYTENLLKAKDILGSFARLGIVCGVSGIAVLKWSKANRPPRTEYTGETQYAELISVAVNRAISANDLLPALGHSPPVIPMPVERREFDRRA